MDDLIALQGGLPGCRRMCGLTAIAIRHFPGDTSAALAVEAQGLAWPNVPGELVGSDPWLVWRSPQETIALASAAEPLRSLASALAPSQSESAMAVDQSDAVAVFELHGSRLDDWLAHLVDATAIPREPGLCSRCRLADVAVLLLRLESGRIWLLTDGPVATYVEDWLRFSHAGAFASSQ
jgi:hypothetical protein